MSMNPFRTIEATEFKTAVALHEEDVIYQRGDVAIINYPDSVKPHINSSIIKVRPVSEYFREYRWGHDVRHVFAHMTDGIGDYFFFSALAMWLQDHGISVTLYVDSKLHDVFDWFEPCIDVQPFVAPIIRRKMFSPATSERLAIEYAGIQGRDRLWISCLFDRIGVTPTEEYLRPRLITERLDGRHLVDPTGVMICHRASSPSRTSALEDFYYPTKAVYPDRKLYVNEIDLSDADRAFCDTHADIEVLPRMTIAQHLLNVYDVAYVVSTDSSAIHFREGVQRPALGVYASMEVKSRTQHYKHVHTFDVVSSCRWQPCYFHQFLPSDTCRMLSITGGSVAPCQSGEAFREQLHSELIKHRIA